MEPWEAPVRFLPLPLPPVHGEVFGWHLNRLAAANYVTSGQLAQTLTPFKNALIGKRTDTLWRWTPMVLPRLALLTGLTHETLRMLLPAISRIEARTGGEVIRYRRRLYVACSGTEPDNIPAAKICKMSFAGHRYFRIHPEVRSTNAWSAREVIMSASYFTFVNYPDIDEFSDFAQRRSWVLTFPSEEAGESALVDDDRIEYAWTPPSGGEVRFVQDATLELFCLGLTRVTDDVLEALRISYGIQSREDLLDLWEADSDREDILLRLANAGGAEYSNEVSAVVEEALSDVDSRVRATALLTAAYLGWNELLPTVERVSRSDEDPHARAIALSAAHSITLSNSVTAR
ncbi:hypothetical protein [Streptomyces sp. I05A-00742]|uniref:hypothetical protein n=1 Tax=Streptomyces sp. I05A-00742 TaxID=2732853 RepID=UPI0014877B7D|nr:hypothetical protein [Streptomyces sp. I05A-00742]